jgi:hypothetical protein
MWILQFAIQLPINIVDTGCYCSGFELTDYCLMDRYQVAVGTSPGGGQVKAFYRIPMDSKHHTVTELNLDGYRQVSPRTKMNRGCKVPNKEMGAVRSLTKI